MASNRRVLLTVTDGCDNRDERDHAFNRAVDALRNRQIFSLSCGIGQTDVDHEGLTRLANQTGGVHVKVLGSMGIAQAMFDLTVFLYARILGVQLAEITQNQAKFMELLAQQKGVARIAVDVMVLIDCSWSMLGMRDDDDWSGDKLKLPRTKEATTLLIHTLNPQYDRVGVARFWEKYQLLQSLTSDFSACCNEIEGIEGGFGTGLYRAMAFAADEF